MIQAMLSTSDNPYNPFDDWDAWYAFDERVGYHSSGLLGRIVRQVDDLGISASHSAIEQAVDEIVAEELGPYIKVTRDVPETFT